MPIDTATPQSPGWWLENLARKLDQRNRGYRWTRQGRSRRYRPGLDLLDDYLRGDPPLPNVAAGWADELIPHLREARMNYAELVVEAPRERMIPLGWTTAVDADEGGDELAARVATANEMEIASGDVFRWMLSLGDGYMMLGDPDPDTGIPVISAEDPRQTITADDPRTRRAIAGLKLYRDEWTGDELAHVFVPGAMWVARRGASMFSSLAGFYSTGWEWDEDRSRQYPDGFEDLVPLVRFRNVEGRGEFETHLDVLDRINSEIFRRVSVAMYQAHRQRAVTGLPDTSDGLAPAADGSNVIDYSEVFTADPGSLWQLPPNTEMWESAAIDLGPIRAAVKDDVQALAAVTRTPLHYITPDAAQGSAEGASVMRESLVYRVEDRRRRASASFARVFSTAFRMMGEAERADVLSIRTLWQPAERYSLEARASAASQLKGVLPNTIIQRDVLQYSPDQLDGLERASVDDLQREADRAGVLAAVAASNSPRPAPAAPPQAAPAPGNAPVAP